MTERSLKQQCIQFCLKTQYRESHWSNSGRLFHAAGDLPSSDDFTIALLLELRSQLCCFLVVLFAFLSVSPSVYLSVWQSLSPIRDLNSQRKMYGWTTKIGVNVSIGTSNRLVNFKVKRSKVKDIRCQLFCYSVMQHGHYLRLREAHHTMHYS